VIVRLVLGSAVRPLTSGPGLGAVLRQPAWLAGHLYPSVRAQCWRELWGCSRIAVQTRM
jgi:hypothetical protein